MNLNKQLASACRLIDRWLAYKVEMGRLPGLSAGIVYQKEVIFQQGYGYADIEAGQKTGATTCYRIASFSKVFTTIAILQLFEQGLLSLDDGILRYLPWFQESKDERAKQITIRQLLTHTSGLDRDGSTPHWVDLRFPTLEEIRQHVVEGAMAYAPIEKWKYSNLSYTLLGEIVRSVTGESYEAYVEQNILQRLALTHTGPALNETLLEHLAVGYGRDIPGQPRERLPQIDTHVMASATGFTSNVADLSRLIMAQFEGDTTLLKDETKREMRRIQWLREGYSSDWCLGLQTWKVDQRRVYGHGGSFQGYQSRFSFDPEQQIGVVLLINALDGPATTLADNMVQTINHIIAHFDEFGESELQTKDAHRYEGRYRNLWGEIDIAEVNGSLIMYNSGPECPTFDYYQMQQNPDGNFTLISGNSIGHLGERVRFDFDDQGNPFQVIVGANPSEKIADL
ncbi:MAG TPA: serine hydrolase [Ktedonobacteraceae bacterium]|nr:serine hydrolase [Ktedonobacteraceae bacterium]